MARPPALTICGTEYAAPLRPGDKVSHMWICELQRGHAGPHLSPSHSISATMASRRFTLRAVIAALPPITEQDCAVCGHAEDQHDCCPLRCYRCGAAFVYHSFVPIGACDDCGRADGTHDPEVEH